MWTYSGDPSDSDKDMIRFLIQDTNSDSQLLSDEEIEALIALSTTQSGSLFGDVLFGDPLLDSVAGEIVDAAASAAERIATFLARKPDRQIGDLKINYGSMAKHYTSLAVELRRKLGLASVSPPWCGGLSHDEKYTARVDNDLVQPAFTRDLHNRRNW